MASSATLLPQIAPLRITLTNRQLFGKGAAFATNFFSLSWSYPFDVSRVDANQIDALVQNINNLTNTLASIPQQISGAALFQPRPSGAPFDVISGYEFNIRVAEIPVVAKVAARPVAERCAGPPVRSW